MEKNDLQSKLKRRFLSIKFILLLIVLLIILIGVIFIISQFQQKPVISNTLSEQSKEYLKEKNTIANSSLKNIAIDDGTSKKSSVSTISVGDCFSIQIPFEIRSIDQNKPCFAYLAIDNPRGRITVYQEDARIGEPEQIPGLSMRRLNTKQYSETDKTINGRVYYIFKRLDQSYEKTAFSSTTTNYFILTLTAADSEDTVDPKLYLMLSSIKFLK